MENFIMKETETEYIVRFKKDVFQEKQLRNLLNQAEFQALAELNDANFTDLIEENNIYRRQEVEKRMPEILARIEAYKKKEGIVDEDSN